ncbi:MAG: LLM class F420-dependent oxidoreductase, partial [Catenulispora sp.]
YHGTHYTLEETLCSPQPVSKPRPRILIGGSGERKTLRLVAQYADACNVFFAGEGTTEAIAARVAAKFDVLRRHCEDVGRPYDEIRRTAACTLPLGAGMTSDEVLGICRAAADAGVQGLICMVDEPHELRHLETLGRDVIPVVADW